MDTTLSHKVGAIQKGIFLGLEVKKHFPQIREEYSKGLSVAQLVAFHQKEWRKIHVFLVAGNEIMQNAFYYALKGYRGNFLDAELEPYEGLMSLEEYELVKSRFNGKKINAVIACGYVPFSEKEIEIIYLLLEKSATKNRIARVVNRLIHRGKEVRTGKTIGSFLSKRKRKEREKVQT